MLFIVWYLDMICFDHQLFVCTFTFLPITYIYTSMYSQQSVQPKKEEKVVHPSLNSPLSTAALAKNFPWEFSPVVFCVFVHSLCAFTCLFVTCSLLSAFSLLQFQNSTLPTIINNNPHTYTQTPHLSISYYHRLYLLQSPSFLSCFFTFFLPPIS